MKFFELDNFCVTYALAPSVLSDEDTLDELSSRATSRMMSGTSHSAPTAMEQHTDSTMPGTCIPLVLTV